MTQQPDPSPLTSLLAAHLDLVYSAALRQTRNPHLAEDITQTVFLLAARKHRSIPKDHTAAWLLNATRFTTLATLRAHRRRTRHEHRAATEYPPMPPAPTNPDLTDLPAHLDAALAKLPATDRELLIRRYFQNHPIAEIATALNLSDNTISKRLARALEKLRQHLAKKGITTPAATLTATLLSTALRPAPKTLAAHILANAALTPATPFGVLLMITPTKILATLAAILLFLTTAAMAFVLTRLPHPPTAPTLPIAAPAPTPTPPSPEQKAEALRALDQCRQSIALLKTSEFSFTDDTRNDYPVHTPPPHESQTFIGHVRRDADGRWFSTVSNSIGPLDAPPVQTETSTISFLHGRLLGHNYYDVPGRKRFVTPIVIEGKMQPDDIRILGYLEDGLVLEGRLLDDRSGEPLAPTFLDIIKSELSSFKTQSDPADHKTLLLTSNGPHGLYQLTLDPAHHSLPLRLEVTKSRTDLFRGQPLSSLAGNTQDLRFPDALMTSAHLLLDHIQYQSFPEGDVITAAEIFHEYAFDNHQTATRHIILHRTDIQLYPHFTDDNFNLHLPDGTPVVVIGRRSSTYPKLEYRNGQILRTSDHQPPTEEESTAPKQ